MLASIYVEGCWQEFLKGSKSEEFFQILKRFKNRCVFRIKERVVYMKFINRLFCMLGIHRDTSVRYDALFQEVIKTCNGCGKVKTLHRDWEYK